MDYAKQKTITQQQGEQLNEFKEDYTAQLQFVKQDMQKQAEADKAQLEREIIELKESTKENNSLIDKKLDALEAFRLEASKGQERIQAKLDMLEKNMLLQFENLSKKLDQQKK